MHFYLPLIGAVIAVAAMLAFVTLCLKVLEWESETVNGKQG
jgi:hypothetical protein